MESGKKNPITLDETNARMNYLTTNLGESNINYNLILALRRSTDLSNNHNHSNYSGQIEIKFFLYTSLLEGQLFLDFIGQVNSMTVNNEKIENINAANHRIIIDTINLKIGSENTVNILFNANFSKTAQGLHYYLDPADNYEYMFTHFEPFDCHKMFPCFDQPDLKARLSINIIAPEDWVVIGNEREKWAKSLNTETEKDLDIINFFSKLTIYQKDYLLSNDLLTKKYAVHVFESTPKISTYLFAIAAGKYHCVNNIYDYPINLRVFCRESSKNFGDPKQLFRIIIAGMEWYKDYFGIAYPFSKYDQIFCPEFNCGAMENVGLVTINECFHFRETPSNSKKSNFAIMILHELAHMWFGNLVTMKWWNDLWLNESFATFISFLCQSECLKETYNDTWIIFNSYKSLAYRSDQLSTTHPVMCEVKNTEIAENHFDALVYYKGSSF